MMIVVTALIFSGALALSFGVIAGSIVPQWRRIVRLASGQTEPAFAPLRTLVHAERRIAVRRWAALPPAPARYPRAAA